MAEEKAFPPPPSNSSCREEEKEEKREEEEEGEKEEGKREESRPRVERSSPLIVEDNFAFGVERSSVRREEIIFSGVREKLMREEEREEKEGGEEEEEEGEEEEEEVEDEVEERITLILDSLSSSPPSLPSFSSSPPRPCFPNSERSCKQEESNSNALSFIFVDFSARRR